MPSKAAACCRGRGKFGGIAVNEFLQLVRSFGMARLAAIIGVSLGVAGAMALIMARIGAPSMSVLYADISYAEAQPIITMLDQGSVDHKLRDNGGGVTILAPRDRISDLRLDLAADGITAGKGVGYEIFDDNQTLGATSFQQNINRLRALRRRTCAHSVNDKRRENGSRAPCLARTRTICTRQTNSVRLYCCRCARQVSTIVPCGQS